MHYIPKIDDYVTWRNIKGWVYYIDETHLTIEISVKPKEDDLMPMHKKHHCLVVVQDYQYDELVYVKSRRHSNASNLDDMEVFIREF
jgi:hypothetical protein